MQIYGTWICLNAGGYLIDKLDEEAERALFCKR